MTLHEDRLARARISLEGLSVGDAFGDNFFIQAETALMMIRARAEPQPPWLFTDDTNMALSIYASLSAYGTVDQGKLSVSFAQHYDSRRGYGPAMHGLLARIRDGEAWHSAARSLFSGQGSFGNGAAMRVAPLGAYFADDLAQVAAQAALSSEVTHAHPEAIAGAIAVAVAAAYAYRLGAESKKVGRQEFNDLVIPYVPESEVRSRIIRARDISSRATIDHVIGMIGNGYQVSAQDTVPFTLYCTGENLSNYEDALWLTASGLGDVDTNCAIVGGIVACYTGIEGIPPEWIVSREPLPEWAFED